MYIPSLNKLQIGLEAAYGDEAAATIAPVGIQNVRVDPRVESEQLSQLLGNTMPAKLAFVKRKWSEGVIEGYIDYERFFIHLDGMFGEATPAGNDRTYLGSLDWDPEVEQSLSLRYGQSGAVRPRFR